MKKNLLLIIMILLSACIGYSQAPGIFNYQGVARNSVGNVLANKTISLRLTIHDASVTGAVVYQESRTVMTNPFGLFNIQVGSAGASAVTGTIAGVSWGTGVKFIQVEIDPNGGSSFLNIGTAQIAAVPYSLFATTAGDLTLPFIRTQSVAGSALIGLTNSSTTGTSGAIDATSASTTANAVAIRGTISSSTPGSFSAGIRGVNNGTSTLGTGVYGSHAGSGWGVYGVTPNGIGVFGLSTSGSGVAGESTSGTGVTGTSTTGSAGVFTAAGSLDAVIGMNTGTGRAGYFVVNNPTSTANGVEVTTAGTGFALRAASTNATRKALSTAGAVQLTGINEGVNKILTSDATGNATWQLPAASTDLVLPFSKTQNETGFLFRLTNSGTTTTSSAIEGITNSQAANVSAVTGTVSSTSPGSRSAGVSGINNGTANFGIGVYGSHAGRGWGVYGNSANGIGIVGNSSNAAGVLGNSTSGDGLDGLSTSGIGVYGTSETGEAGYFEITDNTNISNALTGNTFGSGDAVVGINRGTGRAGVFWMLNPANTTEAVVVNQNGLGHGLNSSIINTGNARNALAGLTNGSGLGIYGRTSGTGQAASFQVSNSANLSTVMSVLTNGLGSGITLDLTNSLNASTAIDVSQEGLGGGFSVQLSRSSNAAMGIEVRHFGVGAGVRSFAAGGNAVWGVAAATIAAGVLGDNTFGEAVVGRNRGGNGVGAVVGRNDSTGYGVRGFSKAGIGVLGQAGLLGPTGVAGRFQNSDTANVSDALQGFTNGRGWVANFINASNTSGSRGVSITTTAGKGGNALNIANGTLATSYQDSYASNTVVDDAILVVTAPGNVTIPTAPPLADGAHVWVVNNSTVLITITNTTTGPLNVAAGRAQHLIFVSAVSSSNWIPAQ